MHPAPTHCVLALAHWLASQILASISQAGGNHNPGQGKGKGGNHNPANQAGGNSTGDITVGATKWFGVSPDEPRKLCKIRQWDSKRQKYLISVLSGGASQHSWVMHATFHLAETVCVLAGPEQSTLRLSMAL